MQGKLSTADHVHRQKADLRLAAYAGYFLLDREEKILQNHCTKTGNTKTVG